MSKGSKLNRSNIGFDRNKALAAEKISPMQALPQQSEQCLEAT